MHTTAARTPDGPTVVEITPAQGFDWTSAAIGAAGGIALALIVFAGARPSPADPAPPPTDPGIHKAHRKEPHMTHRSHLLPLAFATVALLLVAGPASARAGAPETETVYLDGHTAQINTGAAVVFDASPGLLSHASPIFIIGFPVAPDTTGPITLPSGYEPQHNGFPPRRSPITTTCS